MTSGQRDDHAAPGTSSMPFLGLALSGGGVRASLFSLGVVVGLVHLGWNRYVRCIASVSGGSIINAALAHARRLGAIASLEDFEPLASGLASSLSSRGAFAFDFRSIGAFLRYIVALLLRALLPFLFLIAMALEYIDKNAGLNIRALSWSELPWLWIAVAAATSLFLTFIASRGLLQEAKYRTVLHSVLPDSAFTGMTQRLYVRNWGTDEDGDDAPKITHVLVATDLLSGKPMYFSNEFVYCEPYGWSEPRELRTVEALYSSAAFPILFPPKKLQLKRLDFQNGEMSGPLPRAASLADGGVYNNLGTDWFRELEERSDPDKPLLWPFGELKLTLPRINSDNVIVVNAGAPSESVKKVRLIPVARIMSVLYDNTVRPRVREIVKDNRPLIDIADSPLDLARKLAAGSTGDAKLRAENLVTMLDGRTAQFWEDLKRDTAGTATKLTSAGRRAGARLMEHGYLSTIVLMHVRFGAELPDELNGEKYFTGLVAGMQDAESADQDEQKPD